MLLEANHYLFRLRRACLKQPELNAHHLAALDHVFEIASKAKSIEAFLTKTGDLLELARAASLDRAANLRESALRFDDPWLAASASIEYRHALQGKTHAQLFRQLGRGKAAAAIYRERSAQVNSAIGRLFQSLLKLHTSPPPDSELRADIESIFRDLVKLDPAFRPRVWLDQARYRWRIPWSSSRMHDWLASFWPFLIPDASPLPDHEIAADRETWLLRLEKYEGKWPRVKALEVQAASGLAEAITRRQAVWPCRNLARHAQETRTVLRRAGTAIARESLSTERSLSYGVEACWNHLLLTSLLAPLRAACVHAALDTADSELGMLRAKNTARGLTGLNPRQLLAIPAVESFVTVNLARHRRLRRKGLGALAGEAGFDLLEAVLALAPDNDPVDFGLLLPTDDQKAQNWPILHRGVAESLKAYGS